MSGSRQGPGRSGLCAALVVVAGLVTTDAAQAYEFELGAHTELLLELELQLFLPFGERVVEDPDESLDGDPPEVSGDESVSTSNRPQDNDSQLKLGGSHTTEQDFSAYFYVELPLQLGEQTRRFRKPEDRYLGVSGNFGGLQLGAFDDAYENRISGVLDEFEYVGTTDFNLSRRLEYLLAYWTPQLGGFSFVAQTAFDSDGHIDNTEDTTPFTLVAAYSGESYQVSLGYDSGSIFGAAGDQLGAAARFDLEPFRFALKLDTINTTGGAEENDTRLYGAMAMYEYDGGYVAAAVQRIDHTEPVDFVRENRTELVAHASYEVTDFAVLYVEGAAYGRSEELGDYFGIGTYFIF